MLRIAKKSIVSFPNFAFRPLREMLYEQGRAPRAKGWYSILQTVDFLLSWIFKNFVRKKK